MGWTKRDLVVKAYSGAGLASEDEDLTAEERQEGLTSLDAMMASWDSIGIRVGYLTSPTPTGGTIDSDSGIPDYANRAVYMNLAIELAAGVGREVSSRYAGLAKQAYDGLVSLMATPTPMGLPTGTPAGAGNKRWRGVQGPFIQEEDDDIAAGTDSLLDFK